MDDPNSLEKRDYSNLIAFLAFMAIVIVVFLPLVLNFATSSLVPYIGVTQSRDRYHFMWNFWWVAKALISHQSVFYTNLMFAPNGVTLALQTIDFVDAGIAAPVAALAGYVAAFNFVTLFSITLSGFTAFLLTKHLTHSSIASFGAGLIFAFFPQHISQALYGHSNLASIEWIQAYLLALILTFERKQIRYAIIAGVLLALITLTELELLIMGIIGTIVYVIYYLMTERLSFFPKVLSLSAIMAAVWFALSSFYLIPAYIAATTGVRTPPSPVEAFANSAKPIFYLTPPPQSYLYGSFFSSFYSAPSPFLLGNLHGGAPQLEIFVGYVTLALAIIGLLTSKDIRRFYFAGLAAVALILSLGPSPNPLQLSIQTPYTFLYDHITVFQFFRASARFSTLLELALAGLAAFGIESILRLSAGLKIGVSNSTGVRIIGIAILTLILLEFLPVVSLQTAASDPAYGIIESDKSGYFTVLELPATITVTQTALYHQIYYDKPLVNGKISQVNTVLPGYMYSQLFLRILTQYPGSNAAFKKPIVTEPYSEYQLAAAAFSLYRIKYVIVNYNEYLRAKQESTVVAALIQALGPPVYQDRNVYLFELSEWANPEQLSLTANSPIVFFGNGWTQQFKSSMPVVNGATLLIYAPQPGVYSVQMSSTSSVCLSNLNITQTIGGCGSYDPSLHILNQQLVLTGGENTISLHVNSGYSNITSIKVENT